MDPIGEKLLDIAKTELGYREKSGGYTKYGDWYGKNVDNNSYFKNAPWCDMFLAWAADKAGVADWAGQFAYTPFHAKWFREEGAWGTKPKPGAIIFFDWSGSKSLDAIDHVGIVEKVEGKTIHTIEGNVDGVHLKRKERTAGTIVGYGYPAKVVVPGRTVESVTSGATRDTEQGTGQEHVPGHAAPGSSTDRGAPADHGMPGTATRDVGPRGQDVSSDQPISALDVLTIVILGSVALAVGKAVLTRVPAGLPASSPVRFRKRGRHHRTPVALPVGVTPADLAAADSSTAPMRAVTAAVAAEAEDREFWSQVSHLREDDDLAYWGSMAENGEKAEKAEEGAAAR
ncbi:CHAP domain-containing protein [Thermomonospora echinospora]|uniref:CHAP domain-containing protein n=1 Tax=Thermomonospora echinospora TaxID=1992 RepID=A0A1H5TB88_9ACTN|nr:CHAP domain-containing protein [Thermomonospora echinospora]SEF59331.1 CHAP domain-containing protein [Thermomonospora echinospora]